MEAKGALQELECFGGHNDERGKGTAAGSLAIPAVTVKHHRRFSGGLVANRATCAAACEGSDNCGHSYLEMLSPLPVSRNDFMLESTRGQPPATLPAIVEPALKLP